MNPLRIVVAEHDTKVLYAFSKVLEKEGCDCIHAGTIQEALAEIGHRKAHAVFLDISRTEGDYESIFATIAKEQLTMPLVIISSHLTEEMKKLAAAIGALQVIEKPLKVDRVRQCLDRIKAKLIEK